MAMDIGGVANSVLHKATNKNQPNNVSRTLDTAKPEQPVATESVNVNTSVEKVKDMINESTGIDNDKVARIQAMIADGTYLTDSDRTAEKMIGFELNLLTE